LPSIGVSGDDIGKGLGTSNVCLSQSCCGVVLGGGKGGGSFAARGPRRHGGGKRKMAQSRRGRWWGSWMLRRRGWRGGCGSFCVSKVNRGRSRGCVRQGVQNRRNKVGRCLGKNGSRREVGWRKDDLTLFAAVAVRGGGRRHWWRRLARGDGFGGRALW
jgi:hypothetical protein